MLTVIEAVRALMAPDEILTRTQCDELNDADQPIVVDVTPFSSQGPAVLRAALSP